MRSRRLVARLRGPAARRLEALSMQEQKIREVIKNNASLSAIPRPPPNSHWQWSGQE